MRQGLKKLEEGSLILDINKKFIDARHGRVTLNYRFDFISPEAKIALEDEINSRALPYADRFENPVVVRGLRILSDFEYEFMMALTNKKMDPRVETVFLASDERYTYLSSSTVKEIAGYGGDISRFVPEEILEDIKKKIDGRTK